MRCKRLVRLVAFSSVFSVLLALIISGAALAAQALLLSSASGIVGSTLTVTGTEHSANTTGNVTFGFLNPFAANFTATTNAAGGLSRSFPVPTVPNGTYTVFFSENSSSTANATNSSSFTVLAAVGLTPGSGHVGDSISVLGTGYSGNTSRTAVISFDSLNINSVSDNANGSFISALTIPAAVAGAHIINANDGAFSVNATLTVTPLAAISPASGQVGSTTTMTGTGFAGTTSITITFDGTQLTQTTTDATGGFSLGVTVPDSAFGPHAIMASDGTQTSSATFTSTAGITLSASSGASGSSQTVSGTAFAANALVTITLDGVQIAQPTTNTGGSFTAAIVMPASTGGPHTISATDGTSTLTATFTVLTKATVSPTSGKVGSPVAVSGSGFGSGTAVSVSFDSVVQGTVNTDAGGSFSTTFNAPAATSGNHVVSAADSVYSASGTFSLQPNLGLSTARGPMGTQVTLTGTGYNTSSNVTVTMGGSAVARVSTDAKGSFTGSFTVPQIDAGPYTILGTDGTNSAGAAFTLTASFTISTAQGKVGTSVTVTGSGFNGTATVKFDDSAVATAPTSGSNGAFTAVFSVPPSTRGAHNISVNDASAKLQLPFTVSPDIAITPAQGSVGTSVQVSGSGFSGTVTVKYDNVSIATAAAAANGSFSATFTVPASLHGAHIIAINDETTSLTTTFVMDSTAPAVPTLAEPQDKTRQTKQPTLKWGAVTDPSNVTYNLQVAKDAGFSSLVIEKTGLTSAEYVVTAAEALDPAGKGSPYYWRVKAIDEAENESDWSDASNFYVTRLAPAVVWAGGAVVGLVVLALVVKFAIRFARRGALS